MTTAAMNAPYMFNSGPTENQWVFNILPLAGSSGVPSLLTEPAQCATYLTGLRGIVENNNSLRPLIRLWDGNLENNLQVTGELSCSVEEVADETGSLELEILQDNWIVSWIKDQTMVTADLNITVDPHPTKPDWRTRWGGKIVELHFGKNDKGNHTIKFKALSFREHAKRLLIAANPIFPPEVQLPRLWVMPGPCNTVCATTAFVNLGRIFEIGWSQIDNIFNPFAWVEGTSVLPTQWPIQVAFLNPINDQSRWTCIGANWQQNWHDGFKDIMSDAGCFMRVYTYLTTDADSPNEDLNQILAVSGADTGGGDLLGNPQRNCCVFSFENKSGVTGPTGTLLDGLLQLVAVTLDDLITPIAIDLLTGQTFDPGQVLNGETVQDASGIGQTFLIESLLGLAPKPPNVIWWDGQYNGVLTSDLYWHKGSVKTIMVGSHSPVLVNEAQTFAIKYALAELSYLIYAANPDAGAGGGLGATVDVSVQASSWMAPGTPGLEELYQGQLDDVLFAWERFTDPIRAFYSGDLSWQEHFQKGASGTAYTLAGILDIRVGDWNTRAYGTFKASTYDGYPWVADYDYFLGDRVGFEQDGIIWVDNCYRIKREWDWEKPMGVEVTIGDDKQKQDPFGAAFRTIAMVYNLVGNMLGQGTIFTAV